MRKTLLICLSLLLAGAAGAAERPDDPQAQEQPTDVLNLDLTAIKVNSEAARKLLGSDTIRVRNKRSLFVPRGELPLPKVTPLTDAQSRERLLKLLPSFGIDSRKIKELNNAYLVQLEDAAGWVHRASGGYKLTVTKNSMATPTRVEDFREAVQRSLDHVAKNGLLDLTDREEIRVLNLHCGYLEAPIDFEQELLRPGCLVSFSVGENPSDIADQLILALEEDGRPDKLLGTQSRAASGK